MKKNVLVVGGAGYIGGSVISELKKRKIPLTVYDNLLYENQFTQPIDFIFGDVRDEKKLKKIIPKYTHIIWLSAIVGDRACDIDPKLTMDVNYHSVKWLSSNYKKQIIFASTCSVYGKAQNPVHEQSQMNPVSLYAETKIKAEKCLKNKNATILRFGTAYGISASHTRLRTDLAINAMTIAAVTKKQITVYGGKQWRPFIHVRDIAKSIVNAVDVGYLGTVNIATVNKSINSIASTIQKKFPCKINHVTDKKALDERDYRVDLSKAKELGLIQQSDTIKLTAGIKEIGEMIKENRFKDLSLSNFSNEKHLQKLLNKKPLAS